MNEMAAPEERAVLVGAPRKGAHAKHDVQEHREGLSQQANTANVYVVGSLTQQLDRPHA